MNKLIIGLLWAASTLVAGPLIEIRGNATATGDLTSILTIRPDAENYPRELFPYGRWRVTWSGFIGGYECRRGAAAGYLFSYPGDTQVYGGHLNKSFAIPGAPNRQRPTIHKIWCEFGSETTTQ